jgi:arylsulfatase A
MTHAARIACRAANCRPKGRHLLHRITTLLIVAALVALSIYLGEKALASRNSARSNVVIILTDDLGYETVGANGGTSYRTPALDKLAADGVRFSRCHVQPLCTPTRVQLMTGQYNVRNYTAFGEMSPRLKTFANLFRDAGYATCIAGKWQLGHALDLPRKFGFDDACLWQHTRRPGRYRNPGLEVNGKEVDYTGGEYGPDLVSDHALGFITKNRSKPFLLYYPMMLTHGPFEPTPDSPDNGAARKGKGAKKKDESGDRYFAGMVAYMDKLVGKLVAHLDRLGLREDTLVLFVGDNGTGRGIRSRMGDRVVIGGKGLTTEAGTHVPLIASWPGKSRKGLVCDDLVDSTDFLPTICEAAGVAVPAGWTVDGHSFLPQLRGEKGRPREWYYCWYAPRGTMQGEFAADARYKLYRGGEFYDLGKDPEEGRPLQAGALTGEAAAAAKKLRAALDRYKDARPADLPRPKGASR